MWKLIILSLSLAVQANEIENVYGTWTQVAFFPITGNVPACIQSAFDKDPKNQECSCVDGKKATLVQLSLVVNGAKILVDSYPMLAVDKPNEVNLEVNCSCGDQQYETRVIARSVNSNYFLMYEKNKQKSYTQDEPNDVYVFAKEVPKRADLLSTLQSIEDLKNRQGADMCASDVNL